jgi:pyruvate dehydrogenase E2 component (dihydrolipoamide acetyltransferase)
VIRGADRLALAAVGRQVRDLSERARRGELRPGESSGSTISLTNLGGEGIDGFTPILNPPEVAILGAGRIRPAPALTDGSLTVNHLMTLSLTIDHRVIDGLPGARYLRRVAELLAEPAMLVEPG